MLSNNSGEKEESLIDWINSVDWIKVDETTDKQKKRPTVVETMTENARKAKKKIVNGFNGALAILGF